MGFILGIDTGGTYTDACMVKISDGRVVATAKALTNHHNLVESIEQSLVTLEASSTEISWDSVKQISISTTLATNSIVEGKGCRVGLILIGKKLQEPTPADHVYCLSGGHTNSGDLLAELIPEEIEQAWNVLQNQVDAFAIAGYMAIRNPEHELMVRDYLLQRTSKPVVCAHLLARDLGYYERSVTAVLNAKVMPLIDNLFDSVKAVLHTRSIKAPVMVVKGDGTIFPLEVARECPVETVLSGPAASVIGACYLSSLNEATIVDMGGTTLDIAMVNRSLCAVQNDGATIGGWKTQVKTVHTESVGLGGDSHIRYNRENLCFGPRRVIPLSWAAHRYPEKIIPELELLGEQSFGRRRPAYDFFIAFPGNTGVDPGEGVEAMFNAMHECPMSVRQIAVQFNTAFGLQAVLRLEEDGLVQRISLTPTDLLHARGELRLWDTTAPRLALKILAKQLTMTLEEVTEHIYSEFVLRIAREILARLFDTELAMPGAARSPVGEILLERLLGQKEEVELSWKAGLKKPLIAVGAPVKAYFPRAARLLGASLTIPPHMAVASAVGASIAPVQKQAVVMVRPYWNKYSVHSPLGKRDYERLDDAVRGAIDLAEAEIRQYFAQAGIENPEIDVESINNIYEEVGNTVYSESIFLDAKVLVRGRGYPVAMSSAARQNQNSPE